MNGAGNDFIIINNMVEHLPETCFPALARTLCERHLSIGADGLMIVDAPLQGGDYRMLLFNSDGSLVKCAATVPAASAATATKMVWPARSSV